MRACYAACFAANGNLIFWRSSNKKKSKKTKSKGTRTNGSCACRCYSTHKISPSSVTTKARTSDRISRF
jgi:hypothetical protein